MERRRWFLRNFAVTAAALGATVLVCIGMNGMARSSAASSLIFVLCVHIVARLTDGYGWGIAASVAAVLLVNFVFTYPFMEFNFTIAGYPLTFVTMLLGVARPAHAADLDSGRGVCDAGQPGAAGG